MILPLGYRIVKLNIKTMKNVLKLSLPAIIFAVVLLACKKEVISPQEMLEGKWIITSQEILGVTVPGDGSYLIFNACSQTCTGTDYKASDSSSGTFDYILNEEATQIAIVDTMSAGGGYNYTWDILELTETNFRMTTVTILGNLKIEMAKN